MEARPTWLRLAGEASWKAVVDVPSSSAKMMRADLAAAGIPHVNDAGLFADFRALRHTSITRLVQAGVHPKNAQVLARHSTITLTMDKYTHVSIRNTATALESVPAIEPE